MFNENKQFHLRLTVRRGLVVYLVTETCVHIMAFPGTCVTVFQNRKKYARNTQEVLLKSFGRIYRRIVTSVGCHHAGYMSEFSPHSIASGREVGCELAGLPSRSLTAVSHPSPWFRRRLNSSFHQIPFHWASRRHARLVQQIVPFIR